MKVHLALRDAGNYDRTEIVGIFHTAESAKAALDASEEGKRLSHRRGEWRQTDEGWARYVGWGVELVVAGRDVEP